MIYYKAEIGMMRELFVNNDKDQGCDPDTMMDHGIVETIERGNLADLVTQLKNRYDDIEHFEDNRYETGYEETERDGTHVSVMVSIYIHKVVSNVDEVTDPDLFKTKKAV
jgi:hypothetical protein